MQHLIAAHVRQDTAVCKFSWFLMCILYINLNVVWVFSLGYLLHSFVDIKFEVVGLVVLI